jgi:hypothetical protein
MEKFEMITAKLSENIGTIKKKLDTFVSKDEAFWMSISMFLFGVIVGMLISPRKNKTTTIGSNNVSYEGEDYLDDSCDDECECCECE